ncbi:Uncharacterized protein BM_BM664 [Brugia malayi]|uniref:Bm664 n=1 Tax=Brugia malayi TaxID=6279 RepID=A0A0K0JP09_BRUMA|nr:Uncharacterized protein BM_BM664 [Brugia malayi]CDQ00032.1 Bm664 [Brugia malayi]VIO91542.1 Uncharacterized protein BM_BM664 [Brugia malayi]
MIEINKIRAQERFGTWKLQIYLLTEDSCLAKYCFN